MIVPLAVSAAVLLAVLIAASVQDIRSRLVLRITWLPAAAAGIICAVIYWTQTLPENLPVLILSLAFAALMAAAACFGLFGRADAIALILIAVTVPVAPLAPEAFPATGLSSLMNACIIALAVPLAFLIYNAVKGNHAPFLTRISGFPVPGPRVLQYHGFIAEEITEDAGIVTGRFLPLHGTALRTDKARFIRTLKENPEQYAAEIRRYQNREKIWIAAGIPFLVPLTAGFILALFGISPLGLFF